jgi:hypothetical protein
MTGEKKMFTSCDMVDNPTEKIAFGRNSDGTVVGLSKIAISTNHSITDVYFVESLDYNLLSISQLCEMGYNCLFTDEGVTVFRRGDDSVAFKGELKGRLYLVDFSSKEAQLDTCLLAKSSLDWIWHRRLAHVGMNNLNKLLKGDHILGLKMFSLRKIEFVVLVKLGNKLVLLTLPRMCSQTQRHKAIGVASHVYLWSGGLY